MEATEDLAKISIRMLLFYLLIPDGSSYQFNMALHSLRGLTKFESAFSCVNIMYPCRIKRVVSTLSLHDRELEQTASHDVNGCW
jgi:hypothetical protein